MTPEIKKIAKAAIDHFFGNRRYVYAIPGTENHSANFYGSRYICKLSKSDVLACIDTAIDSGTWIDQDDEDQDVIKMILDDLQLEKPVAFRELVSFSR